MAEPNAAGAGGPEFRILAQYVKDQSFENPNAPFSMALQSQPRINIEIDVAARKLGNDQYESALTISVTAKAAKPAGAENGAAAGAAAGATAPAGAAAEDGGESETTVFVIELVYAAAVMARHAGDDVIAAALMVEVPRSIFPFARRVIADVTRDGGFPPMLIDPVDFAALYRRRVEQAKAAIAGADAPVA